MTEPQENDLQTLEIAKLQERVAFYQSRENALINQVEQFKTQNAKLLARGHEYKTLLQFIDEVLQPSGQDGLNVAQKTGVNKLIRNKIHSLQFSYHFLGDEF